VSLGPIPIKKEEGEEKKGEKKEKREGFLGSIQLSSCKFQGKRGKKGRGEERKKEGRGEEVDLLPLLKEEGRGERRKRGGKGRNSRDSDMHLRSHIEEGLVRGEGGEKRNGRKKSTLWGRGILCSISFSVEKEGGGGGEREKEKRRGGGRCVRVKCLSIEDGKGRKKGKKGKEEKKKKEGEREGKLSQIKRFFEPSGKVVEGKKGGR